MRHRRQASGDGLARLRDRHVGLAWIVALALAIAGCAAPQRDAPPAQWPTSTPEAQGIDSPALVALLDAVRAERLPLHSLHIARHGVLVFDASFHPMVRDERHDMASITKSITSLLVGIAIERGALPGVDAPVHRLLGSDTDSERPQVGPGRPSPVGTPHRGGATFAREIRLHHLLTNTSGLDCGTHGWERETLAMAASADWVRYVLDLPQREAPGQRFVYCSPGFHLLSALISRGTGTSAEAFARGALFGPLGIDDWRWPADPQGISLGGGDLQMRPLDLMRIGELLLRGGEWNGRQLVPREWIARSTRAHATTPAADGYGYGWWLPRDLPGVVQATGRGGQRLIVWPEKDLVVAITGGGFDPGRLAPFLQRALRSNKALPDNEVSRRELLERVQAAAQAPDEPPRTSPMPARATSVSGVDFDLEPNPLDLRGMRLTFTADGQARARIRLREGPVELPIGLDGRYRYTVDPTIGGRIAGRGRWLDPQRFEFEVDTIARISHFTVTLSFEADRLHGLLSERAGLVREMPLVGTPVGVGERSLEPRQAPHAGAE